MKNIIAMVLVLVCIISFVGQSCVQNPETVAKTSDHKTHDPTPQISNSIVLNNLEEVKAFIRTALDKPLPTDYNVPAYISSGSEKEVVYQTLEKRYPEIYGLGGNTLLHAVSKYPELYLSMLQENKAIRRYYDPNSKF